MENIIDLPIEERHARGFYYADELKDFGSEKGVIEYKGVRYIASRQNPGEKDAVVINENSSFPDLENCECGLKINAVCKFGRDVKIASIRGETNAKILSSSKCEVETLVLVGKANGDGVTGAKYVELYDNATANGLEGLVREIELWGHTHADRFGTAFTAIIHDAATAKNLLIVEEKIILSDNAETKRLCRVNIGGEYYRIDQERFKLISSGIGQWLTNEDDEKHYIVFDKEQGLMLPDDESYEKKLIWFNSLNTWEKVHFLHIATSLIPEMDEKTAQFIDDCSFSLIEPDNFALDHSYFHPERLNELLRLPQPIFEKIKVAYLASIESLDELQQVERKTRMFDLRTHVTKHINLDNKYHIVEKTSKYDPTSKECELYGPDFEFLLGNSNKCLEESYFTSGVVSEGITFISGKCDLFEVQLSDEKHLDSLFHQFVDACSHGVIGLEKNANDAMEKCAALFYNASLRSDNLLKDNGVSILTDAFQSLSGEEKIAIFSEAWGLGYIPTLWADLEDSKKLEADKMTRATSAVSKEAQSNTNAHQNNQIKQSTIMDTNSKTINEILGVNSTLAFNVELSSSPSNMMREQAAWRQAHPHGIVAYRVFGSATFAPSAVEQGVIGNPFNWKQYGEEKATMMFYNWLHTGNAQGNPAATKEFRNAIIDRLNATPEGSPIFYYKDVGKPSHATILGYFVNNKNDLFDYRLEIDDHSQSADAAAPAVAKIKEAEKTESVLDLKTSVAYGVQLIPEKTNLRDQYKGWLKENPNGIVAYKIFADKTFSERTVGNNIIGNPFDAKTVGGEAEATRMFYEWLRTGENFGEPLAQEGFRMAIINKLKSLPDDAPVLYYREEGAPSHATVIGYFIRHKDQLNSGKALSAAKQNETKPEEAQPEVDLSALSHLSPYQLKSILDSLSYSGQEKNPDYETAKSLISSRLKTGWNRDLAVPQEKAYLLSLIKDLPSSVSESLISFVETNVPQADLGAENNVAKENVFTNTPCDVYTVGLSTKSLDEFMMTVPPATKVLVDTRPKPDNRYRPWFCREEFANSLQKRGIEYVYISETDPQFFEKVLERCQAKPGEVLICSSTSKAETNLRGLNLGPRLERSGLTVGHISQYFNAELKQWTPSIVVRTQEELTLKLLKDAGKEIRNGSYREVSFTPEGVPVIEKSVELGTAEKKVVIDRNNYGKDNYDNPVEVIETDNPGVGEAFYEASKQAHFTLVFKSGHPSPQEKAAIDVAGGACAVINVPDDDSRLRDMDYAREVVYGKDGKGGFIDRLNRSMLKQAMQSMEDFDPKNLVLQIEGLSEARLLNKPAIDSHVTDEELQTAGTDWEFNRLGGRDEGFIVVRPSHASIEDFQAFVKNVITVINEPEVKSVLGENVKKEKDYQFKGIVSTGETGAGEAGILAAQEFGMKAIIQAPKEFKYTMDNGTLRGRVIKDEASFLNRFKLGLKKAISEDDLRLQIDQVHEAGKNISGPGLTDRQVLTLSSLGYTNSDIITMQQQCLVNGIKIKETPVKDEQGKVMMTASEGLMDLIEQCTAGYGVGEDAFSGMSENLNLGAIIEVEKDVDKMLNNCRRNGIGVMTIANPYYPDQFKAYDGFKTEKTIIETINSDGSAYTESTTVEVKEERPVVLSFKGNIDALSLDKVTITGNTKADDFERKAAKNIGSAVAEQGFAAVTAFRPTTAISHSPAQINGSLNVLGRDFDNLSARPGKAYSIQGVPMDSPFFAAAAAMDKGAVNIAISPNSLNYTEDQDRIQNIIKSRGVVLSEGVRLGDEEGGEDLAERAGHIACAIGGKAIVVGSTPTSFALSPAFEAQSAPLGIVAVDHKKPVGEDYKIEGNENLIAAGVDAIPSTGIGLSEILGPLRTFSFEEQADKALEEEITRAEAIVNSDKIMHVDNYQFSVVRAGSEQIFVVPTCYPDVREAVKQAYGENVIFSESASLAMRNLRDGLVTINDETTRTFDGYKGTQLLRDEPYKIPLFYQKGQIYSVVTAPRNTPGIIRSQNTRMQNMKDFEKFKDLALKVQEKFLDKVYADSDGKHSPIRFENAFYPVISQHSVKIYQGEELRAHVYIDERGSLKVRSYGNLADDLTEYSYSKYIFPRDIDSERVRKTDGETSTMDAIIVDLAARMEAVLLSVPVEETEMFTLATREEQESITERLKNGFLELSEDNIETASDDIFHGINAGLLGEFSPEAYSRNDAVAALLGEKQRAARDVARLKKEDQQLDKKILDLERKRDAAYNQGYSVQEYEKIDQAIEDLRAEKCDILSGINASRQRHAILLEKMGQVATAEKVFLSKSEALGGEKKLALYVDGASIEIIPSLITPKTKSTASDFIEYFKAQKMLKTSTFNSLIEKVESYNADIKDMGVIFDQRNKEGFGKAKRSEIKPESFSNGRFIIVRNGGEAYADQAMNIRSEFFDSLKPWHGTYGEAKKDGKSNFIDPTGEPIIEVWYDKRGNLSEGSFVVEVDGNYGIVGAEGNLFGGRLFDNAHPSKNGWCAVRADLNDKENAGKYNYVNAKGEFLSKTWLDDCNDFNQGKALIKIGKTFKEIDTTGKILRDNVKVNLAPGQSLFNGGSGGRK